MQSWKRNCLINILTHPVKYVFRLNKDYPYLTYHHGNDNYL
ncbi:MAG TPA: hypothetical protein VGK46_13840 [Saprospiraceae bacterium]